MSSINELRDSLIKEAKSSPMLLCDLAGLEAYVSESYNSRSFIELLQNADDAGSTRFYVKRYNNYLLVANDGRPFDIKDVESLCRSASSNKTRGTSIGYRGIGFKSVVSIAKEIHLVSGEYGITFSKELTKAIIEKASKVPLIRIPHELQHNVRQELDKEIAKIQKDGYNTIFIFSGVIADQIDEEYTSFAYTTLMFLKNVRNIKISLNKEVNASINVLEQNGDNNKIRIASNDTITEWFVCSNDNCSIAFAIKNGKINRLPKEESVIHAFLPTEDCCGFGFIVNGDFSTDPSRRHLIFDETTKKVISEITRLYSKILQQGLQESNESLLNAIIPYFDVKLIQLMKQSFEREFANLLRTNVGTTFSKIRLSPSWFNVTDFHTIMSSVNKPCISPECAEVNGLDSLLRYLGSKIDDIDTIISFVNPADISLNGCAQLAAYGMKQTIMNHKVSALTETSIFVSGSELCSISVINENENEIDDSFLQLMIDNGISKKDIGLCLKKLGMMDLFNLQFKEETQEESNSNDCVDDNSSSVRDWFNACSPSSSKPSSSGVQKWRSAEENALAALNENGFNLNDVSTQNVGYDLSGTDPNGNDIYIEVKSIEYAGQKFRMTNNEFAAAQYYQDKYYIAIVRQAKEALEISLVKNPIRNLNMNRQCVQWVWECNEYEYKPMKFKMI